jgi:tRNA threonylcarbamoyladenosine biosynthesis protein TsaB
VIIAMDAASTDLSVAVATPDGSLVSEDAWGSSQRQSAELLPRLLAVLDGAGHPITAVTALAVGTGPGSFTGLRVAMALAKGLAAGLGRPIVGVPSLLAWLDAEPEAAAAVARAGANEAYVLERWADEPRILGRGELPAVPRPLVAAAELATAFGLDGALTPRAAAAIASLAARRLVAAPAGDDLATLEPIYLRAPRGVAAESGEAVRWL